MGRGQCARRIRAWPLGGGAISTWGGINQNTARAYKRKLGGRQKREGKI